MSEHIQSALIKGVLLAGTAAVVVGCGGGGGGGESTGGLPGGPTPSNPYSISLSADATQLPLNTLGLPAGIGVNAPYTTTLYVTASRGGTNDPIPNTEGAFSCNVSGGLNIGALYYLDGDEEHQDDDGNALAYRSISLDSSAGGASFHFHAGATAGTTMVNCSVTDPQSGRVVSATRAITVGQATGQPAQVVVVPAAPGVVFAQNTNGSSVLVLQARILDDAGQPVANPAAGTSNLIASIVPTPGGADDFALLSAGGVTGRTVTASSINGLAQFSLISGAQTGSVLIRVEADRRDNNVTNGVSDAASNLIAVPVVESISADTSGPLAVTSPAELPGAAQGQPYAAVLAAQGGVAPYRWSLVPGSILPGGLTLSPDGIISGIPNSSGPFRFALRVTDSSATGAQSVIKDFSLSVQSSAGALTVSTASLPQGAVGVFYAASLSASGGAQPYTWTSSALPAGLALDARSGFITGTPARSGSFNLILSVTDGNGIQSNRNLTLVVDGAPGSGATVDTTAPEVLFTIPASGATDVDRCSDVVVRFNEAIDPLTVNNVSMFVRRAGGATFSMAGTTQADDVTFTLNQFAIGGCYAPATDYELVLTSSIRDISNNPLEQRVFPFSTGGSVDDVPPQVAFTIPANGAVDVSPTANVTVVFNEAMDTDSIVPQSFAVYRITGFGGTPTQVTVGPGSDSTPSTLPTATDLIAETDRRFTFGPVEYGGALPSIGINLVPGQHYRVVMSASPRDLAGNQICNTGGECGTAASPVEGNTPSYQFEFRVGVQ